MITEKLDIMKTIREGIQYGLKNFLPLLLMVVLYLITIWIPYLNVGTTIGIYKAVIKIGRGEMIDPVAIFDKENFEKIGNFFLLQGLVTIGVMTAAAFVLFPAIVIGIAWAFAVFFLIDKKVSPLKALQLSYDSTYGNKWRIFFVTLICSVLVTLICSILGAIPKVGPVLAVIAALLCAAIVVAVDGVMYNYFSQKADLLLAEHRAKYCGGHTFWREAEEAAADDAPAGNAYGYKAEEPGDAAPNAESHTRDYSAYAPKADTEPAAGSEAEAADTVVESAPEAPAADESSPYAPKPDDL